MKIPALIQPQRAQEPVSGAAPEPAAPFEQILEDSLRRDAVRRERAFGFSELGVFGAARPGTVAAAVESPRPPAGGLVAAQPVPSEALQARAPANTPTASTHRHEAGETPFQPRLQHSARPNAAMMPLATIAATNAAREASPQAEEEPSVRQRQVARRHTDHRQAGRLNLLVSGQNGVVQVLAGSPELGPEARERLRRAAAELSAEFGVTLARFTLNGSDLEPDFVSRIGAPRGDHRG